METEKQKLLDRREELRKRLAAIRADMASGLDADSKEQAIQLENAEAYDVLVDELVNVMAQTGCRQLADLPLRLAAPARG